MSARRLALVGVTALSFWVAGCQAPADSNAKVPMGAVDVPRPGSTISGRVDAIGWAVSEDRIAGVSVYVDRAFWGKCKIGGSRPDVSKVYPNFPEGDNSGWTVALDSGALPAGTHELLFQAMTSKGAVRDLGPVQVVIVR